MLNIDSDDCINACLHIKKLSDEAHEYVANQKNNPQPQTNEDEQQEDDTVGEI